MKRWRFLFLAFLSLLVLPVVIYILLPPVFSLERVNPGVTAFMRESGDDVTQTWVPIKKISPALRRAVLAAEDGSFYQHPGIDWLEMRRSVEKNLREKRYSRGFSTITMQLARNLYLTRDKSLLRKVLEIAIAFKLEHQLSKNRILEIYLNVVEWADGIYGAEAAAHHYFNKPAAALTADEACFLAAILPSPRRWGRWPPGPYVRRRMNQLRARIN